LAALGPEFLDEGEYQALVLAQEFTHLFAVPGLGGFGFLDGLRIQEVQVNLAIQIVPIRNDDEGVVPGVFVEDLAGQEDHGKAFAGTLGMPKHA